jgi:hypothetical protein
MARRAGAKAVDVHALRVSKEPTTQSSSSSRRWISAQGFDQTSLRFRQCTAGALDRVDREHRCLILIVRMEVWSVMRLTGSTNMRMTIPKNRDSSGT